MQSRCYIIESKCPGITEQCAKRVPVVRKHDSGLWRWIGSVDDSKKSNSTSTLPVRCCTEASCPGNHHLFMDANCPGGRPGRASSSNGPSCMYLDKAFK